MVGSVDGECASSMKVDGGWPRLAAEPVWWKEDGSEFSSVLRSPFGLKWERMGTAPAKGCGDQVVMLRVADYSTW